MHHSSSLLGLPSSLLLLLAAQLTQAQADAQRLPTAIRKMGTDAGEKFLHEYSAFHDDDEVYQLGTHALPAAAAQEGGPLTPAEAALLAANASASIPYRAPFAAHLLGRSGEFGFGEAEAEQQQQGKQQEDVFRRAARWAEARLARRDFSCPTGSSDCAAIGYPDSCCQTGTTCVVIADTGLGAVGCCPEGESCTGTIACTGGQQGCSSDSGGGCCISGYACASVGCK